MRRVDGDVVDDVAGDEEVFCLWKSEDKVAMVATSSIAVDGCGIAIQLNLNLANRRIGRLLINCGDGREKRSREVEHDVGGGGRDVGSS